VGREGRREEGSRGKRSVVGLDESRGGGKEVEEGGLQGDAPDDDDDDDDDDRGISWCLSVCVERMEGFCSYCIVIAV